MPNTHSPQTYGLNNPSGTHAIARNTMKSRTLYLLIFSIAYSTQAETLLYDFETGMRASGTNPRNTTLISWNPKNTGIGDSARARDSITPGNNLFLINSRHNDDEAKAESQPGSYTSFFEFTVSAAGKEKLNFSNALLSVDLSSYRDSVGDYTTWYRVYTQTSDKPGVWVQQGSRRNLIFTQNGSEGFDHKTHFINSSTGTPVSNYGLAPEKTRKFTFNRSMDLSGLGTLEEGVDLTVRLMIADNRKSNLHFYSSVDNIKLDGFTIDAPKTKTLGMITAMAEVFFSSTHVKTE